MPTPTYVSASNFIKGVAAAETGINISDFRQGWSDEKIYIENKGGSPTGFVHNFLVASTCTITGEVNTSALSGVLGVAQGTAETIANSTDGYGVSAGGWYMDDIEISQSRGALATSTINFTRHPDIT
jgi:hypothetical protein